ncbi:hypothetical protein ACKWTF_014187 [Chironomus riparius]
MTIEEFVAIVIVLFSVAITTLLICYYCCGVTCVKEKKRRPLYSANFVGTGSAHSALTQNETVIELIQQRLHQQPASLALHHSSAHQQSINQTATQHPSRERTSSDPYAGTRIHPRIHQLTRSNQSRQKSLENINQTQVASTVQSQNPQQAKDSIVDCPPSYNEAVILP